MTTPSAGTQKAVAAILVAFCIINVTLVQVQGTFPMLHYIQCYSAVCCILYAVYCMALWDICLHCTLYGWMDVMNLLCFFFSCTLFFFFVSMNNNTIISSTLLYLHMYLYIHICIFIYTYIYNTSTYLNINIKLHNHTIIQSYNHTSTYKYINNRIHTHTTGTVLYCTILRIYITYSLDET